MERIQAKIISKKFRKSFSGNEYYILVFEFADYYNIHDGSSISEVKVSKEAYKKLEIGDKVWCPMLKESEGLVYDYKYPLHKI